MLNDFFHQINNGVQPGKRLFIIDLNFIIFQMVASILSNDGLLRRQMT